MNLKKILRGPILYIVLAIVAYVAFIYAGVKKHPGAFFKNSLFPSGVPWFLYLIVTPIEFLSTFILRPITLALRLLMNMVAGHMLKQIADRALEEPAQRVDRGQIDTRSGLLVQGGDGAPIQASQP